MFDQVLSTPLNMFNYLNPLAKNVPHHIETANGLYMMGTLVLNGLKIAVCKKLNLNE